MLTVSTPIPTSARGKVRALVKAHQDWRLFLEAKGIISADAKNRDLLEFALFHPKLAAQIEQLINPLPTLEAQVAEIERLMRAFFQRHPQRKPRIRVQAVREEA